MCLQSKVLPTFLVITYNSLSLVPIRFNINRSVLTRYWNAKCLTSICLVRFVGWPALAIKRPPWLSSNSVVASCCEMPMSCSIDRMYRITLAASHAAINSAFVDDKDTVVWIRVL